jgi:two-component system, cell cycle response regulator DivK
LFAAKDIKGEANMPKILVVEDNETNRDLLRRRLERKGHQVITANDGEQGYSLAHTEVPDLVLMDISLPGMNGWQVAQLLKTNDITRHIPIIVLTAHALISDREKAFETGCNDYETKPIEFGRLHQKIENLLLEKKPA